MSNKPQLSRYCLLVALISFCLSGCAKGPSGGPTLGNAANQLFVSMTMQQPINPNFYYDFAFDDDGSTATGPQAIVGSTTYANGVVGGSFTVLVQYHGGQYLVWRRTDLGGGQERLDLASSAFVTPPQPTFGNAISFTLNLDAKTDAGVALFTAGTQRLEANFVTTSEIRRDPNDLRRKPFDAFGPFTSNVWLPLDIRGNQTYTNANLVPSESANDVNNDGTLTPDQMSTIDITDFTIQILRLNG